MTEKARLQEERRNPGREGEGGWWREGREGRRERRRGRDRRLGEPVKGKKEGRRNNKKEIKIEKQRKTEKERLLFSFFPSRILKYLF